MTASFVLDEHVGRVFEGVLRERGYLVEHAKDSFGEHTRDSDLLSRSMSDGFILITNNAKDFEPLHQSIDHGGLIVYHEQRLPDVNPEGLARAVDEVVRQYGEGITNELVYIDEWYDWLHG